MDHSRIRVRSSEVQISMKKVEQGRWPRLLHQKQKVSLLSEPVHCILLFFWLCNIFTRKMNLTIKKINHYKIIKFDILEYFM